MARELPLTDDGYVPPAPLDEVKAWCSCSDTDRRWFGQCARCPDRTANILVRKEADRGE